MDRKKLKIACMSFWPLVPSAYTYIVAPGFIIPFFNHPVAQKVMLFALFWLVVGFFVMQRHSRPWQILISQFVFPLPVLLLPMLGPALVTIITAFN